MDAPLTEFQQVLQWLGFEDQGHRDSLEDELRDLASMSDMTYKDISELQSSYAKRTIAEGRIHFGMNRTKRLKALIDWIHDLERIGESPHIDEHNEDSFLEALQQSSNRATIRQVDEETMSARAKEAAPGNLTGETMWEKWETKLTNMLSIQVGVFGVPLAYVIRESDVPDPDASFDTFVEKCIANCPLEGPKYEADARMVHQIIMSYTTGETAEQWLKPHAKKANGRLDMKALRDYYRGEGNQTRRVSDAEKLRDTLHYKSEGAMPFAAFLSKCQKMFNMFEESKEPYTEAAKLRFLFEKVQNAELRPAIESLKAGLVNNSDAYTFTSASNHLAAQVKPRTTRGLSAVGADLSRAEIMKDGKIFTGYYRNWTSIKPDNQKLVIAERERLGARPGNNKKGGKREKNSLKAQVKALRKKNDKQKAYISSLKRGSNSSEESASSSNESVTNDAGNAFGGRHEKTKKKAKQNKTNRH